MSFYDVFGYLGVASIIVFVFSALWALLLAVIQVYPNEMANKIMHTSDFDSGEFWLLPKPDMLITATSVVILVLVAFGYLSLAVYMVVGLRRVHHPSAVVSLPEAKAHQIARTDAGERGRRATFNEMIAWLTRQITSPTPLRRHYYNVALDVPKLIFQTTTLFTYLDRGFPTALIYFYSVLLLVSWLVSCYRYQRIHADPHLVIARLFYGFDLFFAVFAPLTVLVYFILNFDFDRAAYALRLEILPKETYDNTARLFGSPSQISSFCSAFHYLQITSGSTLFYKSALSVLSLYKWRKITVALIHNNRSPSVSNSAASTHVTATEGVAVKSKRTNKRDWPKLLVAGVFLFAGLTIFTYSIVTVDSTHKHFYEWNNPVDTTSHLSELAVAGELRIIQIINRALPEIPASVRNCKHLEQMILIYTKTEHLPDWISEFSSLEYFHYEGDFTSKRLQALPDGMFDHFPHMTFLQLGAISKVPKMPSVSKLHQLQYLAIAGGFSLTGLPSLEGLNHFNILTIVDVPLVPTLPSFAPLAEIRSISLRYRIPMCCNGFVTGQCDLTDYSCAPKVGEVAMQCTDERISAADNATLITHGSKYYSKNATTDLIKIAPTAQSTDGLCGSIMYKQCEMNGKTGMCFNSRMQVINCVTIPDCQTMRRLQIARGVGDPCDPAVEAWLGCV